MSLLALREVKLRRKLTGSSQLPRLVVRPRSASRPGGIAFWRVSVDAGAARTSRRTRNPPRAQEYASTASTASSTPAEMPVPQAAGVPRAGHVAVADRNCRKRRRPGTWRRRRNISWQTHRCGSLGLSTDIGSWMSPRVWSDRISPPRMKIRVGRSTLHPTYARDPTAGNPTPFRGFGLIRPPDPGLPVGASSNWDPALAENAIRPGGRGARVGMLA